MKGDFPKQIGKNTVATKAGLNVVVDVIALITLDIQGSHPLVLDRA
jgi:hypothetical protein